MILWKSNSLFAATYLSYLLVSSCQENEKGLWFVEVQAGVYGKAGGEGKGEHDNSRANR